MQSRPQTARHGPSTDSASQPAPRFRARSLALRPDGTNSSRVSATAETSDHVRFEGQDFVWRCFFACGCSDRVCGCRGGDPTDGRASSDRIRRTAGPDRSGAPRPRVGSSGWLLRPRSASSRGAPAFRGAPRAHVRGPQSIGSSFHDGISAKPARVALRSRRPARWSPPTSARGGQVCTRGSVLSASR